MISGVGTSLAESLTGIGQSRQRTEVEARAATTHEEAFQQFVAGTFYAQMLKSLRSTEGETPYLDGGQAESIFRAQLDQELASQLATQQGDSFAAALYSAHRDQLRISSQPNGIDLEA